MEPLHTQLKEIFRNMLFRFTWTVKDMGQSSLPQFTVNKRNQIVQLPICGHTK